MIPKQHSLFLLFLLTLPLFSIWAQEGLPLVPLDENLEFEHLRIEDGLPSNVLHSIFQDSKGFMWFGSDDGLVRYDGYELKIFKNDPDDHQSISDNYISAIYEDQAGSIWIGANLGLNKFDRSTETFKTYLAAPNDSLNLIPNRILSFHEDQNGDFWIGTDNKGIYLMDREKELFYAYEPDRKEADYRGFSNPIRAIVPDPFHPEKLWVGGRIAGLNHGQFDISSRSFIPYPQHLTGTQTFGHTFIYAICKDQFEQIWIGTEDGLDRFDADQESFITYHHDPDDPQSLSYDLVSSIFAGHSGQLWIGTYNGLNKFNGSTNSFRHYDFDPSKPKSLAGNSISAVFEDRSGVLWVGGIAGLSFADKRPKGFRLLQLNPPKIEGLIDKSVAAIYEDRAGGLWIAAMYQGLNYYQAETQQFQHYAQDRVISMCEDQQGMLWLGTNYLGLSHFDPKNGTSKVYKNDPNDSLSLAGDYVSSVLKSRNGTIWIGTSNGLQKFDKATENFHLVPLFAYEKTPPFVLCLYEDHSGFLWIGTENGLLRINPETGTIRTFVHVPDDRNSLTSSTIFDIQEDNSGNIWVGTISGLNKLVFIGHGPSENQEVNITRYTEKDGLPNNSIRGILEDDHGRLWISSNSVLSIFKNPQHDPSSPPDFRNYGITDGLKFDQFQVGAVLKNSKGELFFGSQEGLTVFHPDSIRDNAFVPPIVITSFEKFDPDFPDQGAVAISGISEKKEVQLSYKNNIFTIGFAALSFREPHKNQYAYLLEGFNDNWIQLGTRHQVTFTNLDPGTYTFRVKGSNNDGVWNETGTSLKITIVPPWWKTGWAYALYASILLTILYLIRRFEVNRRQLKFELDIRQIEADKLKELDLMKSHFFANITHEFRTPLTVILGTNEQLARSSKLPAVQGKLKLIKRNGENLLRLINQLLDLAKLESRSLKVNYVQGDVLPYLHYISESLHSLANAQNVLVRIESEQAVIVMDYDPERLLQIVHNLLSNAIKFTPSGGRIALSVSKITNGTGSEASPFLLLKVTDTGAGIPKEDLPRIFDRFYQAQNLEKAKAGGTGIGLALTKELVGTMGGEITVESEVGKGTTFTVRLPITNQAESIKPHEPAETPARPSTIHHPPSTPEVNSGQAVHLLLIEDNPDVVEFLTACLQDRYALDFAYNGRSGIEKALESIPDIIISDVMMPEKDGFEVCDSLKNDERTSHIPIILLTAKADIQSRLAGLRRGADAYLSKPFHQEELLVTLANLLELRKKLQDKFKSWEVGHSEISADQVPVPQSLDFEDAFLKKIIVHLEKHLDDADYSIPHLSRAMGLSQSQLYRKIKALTDLSTAAFIRRFRLLKGKQLLETTELTISEIAYEVGFTTLNYFSDAFLEEFGQRPNAIRN